MKRLYWVGILLGTGLLCGLGVWIAAGGPWQVARVEVPPTADENARSSDIPSAVAGPTPKLVVDRTEHHFGAMEPMKKAEHAFVVRNEGSGPLELTPGPTSCKCTVSNLPDRIVPPGKLGRIVLSWHTTEKEGDFKQVATIWTNDPARRALDLRIQGTIRAPLCVEPAQVFLPGLEPGKTAAAEALVFSDVWPDFSLAKIRSSRPGLTWSVEPADPAQLKQHAARAGYRLKISLASDLPGGAFSEWLQVEVDPRDGATPFQTRQVIVAGEVLPRMAIYGEKLATGKVLKLGVLRQGKAAEGQLTLVLRDEPRRIAVQRIETRPEFLRVRVAPVSGEKAKAGVYRIDVEVPPNAPIANFMGANRGDIVIVTDHPRVPRMRFQVELAVVDIPMMPRR